MPLLKRNISHSPPQSGNWLWNRLSGSHFAQVSAHSANFLDLSNEDIESSRILDLQNSPCIPTLRLPESRGRRSTSAAAPGSRPTSSESTNSTVKSQGISWLEFQNLADESADKKRREHCRHCNMRVAPVASMVWHERICALNSEPLPEVCELCEKPLGSLLHARNHYLYGCTP